MMFAVKINVQWPVRKMKESTMSYRLMIKQMTQVVTETGKRGTKKFWSRSGLVQLELEVSHEGEVYYFFGNVSIQDWIQEVYILGVNNM